MVVYKEYASLPPWLIKLIKTKPKLTEADEEYLFKFIDFLNTAENPFKDEVRVRRLIEDFNQAAKKNHQQYPTKYMYAFTSSLCMDGYNKNKYNPCVYDVTKNHIIVVSLQLLYLVLNQGYEVVKYDNYSYIPLFQKESLNYSPKDEYILAIPDNKSFKPTNLKICSLESAKTLKYHYLFEDDECENLINNGLPKKSIKKYPSTKAIKTIPRLVDLSKVLKNRTERSDEKSTTADLLCLTEEQEKSFCEIAKHINQSQKDEDEIRHTAEAQGIPVYKGCKETWFVSDETRMRFQLSLALPLACDDRYSVIGLIHGRLDIFSHQKPGEKTAPETSLWLLYRALTQGYKIIKQFYYLPVSYQDQSKNKPDLVVTFPNQGFNTSEDLKIQAIDSIDKTKYHYLLDFEEYQQLLACDVPCKYFKRTPDSYKVVKTVSRTIDITKLLNTKEETNND